MYFKREIEDSVLDYLATDEILVVIGARQSGKTTLLRKIQEILDEKGDISFFVNLENPKYLSKLDEDYENLFEIIGNRGNQRAFVFIDEVQYLKAPSNFLKYIFDEYKGKIKLIVSGSSAFYIDQKFKDSLAGRKRLFELNLLNFREFLCFKGFEDIRHLFIRSDKVFQERNISLVDINQVKHLLGEFIKFGAYPGVVLEKTENGKKNLLEELFNSYLARDVEVEGVRNKTKFYTLTRIIAEQVGSLFNSSELANTLGISVTAIENYIYILEKSFQIKRIRPFYKNIRKELTKMPKIYFLDTGIRNVVLDDYGSLENRIDRGPYFENFVFKLLHDKRSVKTINFWRTQEKHEIDFIVNRKIAIETKFNARSFQKSKYCQFTNNYKDIPLILLSYEDKDNGHPSILDLI